MVPRPARNLFRALRLSFAAISAVVFMLFLSPPSYAQTSITVAMPTSFMGLEGSVKELAREIAGVSSGDITFELKYDHGMKGLELIEAVKAGTFDMAPVSSAVLDKTRILEGVNIPFALNGTNQLQDAINQVNELIQEELGVQHLSTTYHGAYAIVGAESFHTPEQMNDKRIASTRNFSPFGAIDVNLLGADVFQEYKSGNLDAFEAHIFDPRIEEHSGDTLTWTNHGFATASTFVNTGFYDSMSEDQRELLRSKTAEWAKAFNWKIIEQERSKLELLQKEYGIEVSPAQSDTFRLWLEGADIVPELLLEVSGNTGCASADQCMCKTDFYGRMCSCDRACLENLDCKP